MNTLRSAVQIPLTDDELMERTRAAIDVDDWSTFLSLSEELYLRSDTMKEGRQQSRELFAAKWELELPGEHLDPWQWAWRRPSKRTGKPGRRFASTNQAWRAMKRERGEL